LRPLVLGGGQERELRSGTHDVAGIVGFAAALRAVLAQRDETVRRVRALRDRLAAGLLAAVTGTLVTGTVVTGKAADGAGDGGPAEDRNEVGVDGDDRLPGTLHVCLPDVESEPLLFLLDEAGVCASAASACASGAQQASHVLAAMGVPADRARGALRLSLGWSTTGEDVDHALRAIPASVARLQGVPA
jgi:cysteine desulfurase